jgi:hypothetical protein
MINRIGTFRARPSKAALIGIFATKANPSPKRRLVERA